MRRKRLRRQRWSTFFRKCNKLFIIKDIRSKLKLIANYQKALLFANRHKSRSSIYKIIKTQNYFFSTDMFVTLFSKCNILQSIGTKSTWTFFGTKDITLEEIFTELCSSAGKSQAFYG